MPFPFKEKEKIEEFLLEFFKKLICEERVSPLFTEIKSISIHLDDVNVNIFIDTGRKKVEVKNNFQCDTKISLNLETFHKIYTGELNPMFALREEKIKPTGRAFTIMKFFHPMPIAVRIYKELLKERGVMI